jgi:pimeloyl-ACP methyl ester carboxylesterase
VSEQTITPGPARSRWLLAAAEHGSGTPVVLLHAFPTDRRLYAGLAARVEARLVMPDLPGFGATRLGRRAPDVLSIPLLAEAVAEWLDKRGLGPVVLGGTAIGGYIAIEIADSRPDLLRGLVLLGCKPAADPPARAADRESVAKLALESGSVLVADAIADGPLGPGADEKTRAIVRRMIEEADPRAIAGLVRGLAARPDPTPMIQRLSLPLLVVAGEQDPFTHLEDAEALAAMVPGARFVAVPGAGHLAALERPVEVAAALNEFIQTLS